MGSFRTREIVRRLLVDGRVLSVTVDARENSVTIFYRDASRRLLPLSELAIDPRYEGEQGPASRAIESPRLLCWPDATTGRCGYVREPRQATGWLRWLHLTLAGVWFLLAVIGAILPGLPTTIFLLMCSYSLLRSSHRLHNRLLGTRWFGPSLRHWQLYRGVRPGVKTKALSMLVLIAGATVLLSGLPTAALAGIVGGAAIGAACILRLRVVDV